MYMAHVEIVPSDRCQKRGEKLDDAECEVRTRSPKICPFIVQVLGSEEDLVGEPINDYNDFDL